MPPSFLDPPPIVRQSKYLFVTIFFCCHTRTQYISIKKNRSIFWSSLDQLLTHLIANAESEGMNAWCKSWIRSSIQIPDYLIPYWQTIGRGGEWVFLLRIATGMSPPRKVLPKLKCTSEHKLTAWQGRYTREIKPSLSCCQNAQHTATVWCCCCCCC